MLTHAEARAVILRAWPFTITDRAPTLAEVYAVQTVGLGEGSYGAGWGSAATDGTGRMVSASGHAPDAVGSHNWGAIQCSLHWKQYRVDVSQFPRWVDPRTGKETSRPDLSSHPVPSAVAGHCFLAVDSSPSSSGAKWYAGPYRSYATHEEGAADVIRLLEKMGVLRVAREQRHVYSVAARMYDAGYYQGFSTDRDTNIQAYAKGMATNVDRIAKGIGEAPGLGTANAPAPVLPLPGGAAPAPFPVEPEPSGPTPSDPGDRDGPPCLADRLLALRESVGAIRVDLMERLEDAERELVALELLAQEAESG